MQQNIDDIKCNDMPDQAAAGTQRTPEMPGVSGIWTYETASNADRAGMPGVPGVQEGRAYGAASDVAPARTWGGDDVGSHGDDGVIVGTPASSTWGDEPSSTDPGITQPGATLPDAHLTHQANMDATDPGATMPGATMPPVPAWQRPVTPPRPVRLASMRAEFVPPMAQPVPPATHAVPSAANLVPPMAQPVSSIAEFFSPATEPLAAADDYSTQEMVLEQTNVPLASSARVAGRELTALPRVDDVRFQASYDEDGGQFRPGPPRPGSYGRPARATAPLASPVPRRASGQLTRRATGTLAASERTRRTSGQLTRRATSSLAVERARTSGPLPARASRSLAAPEQVIPSGYLPTTEWEEVQQTRGERDTVLLVLVALFILGVAGVLGFGYLLSLSSVHLTSFLAG